VAEAALYVPLGRGEPGVVERARALFERRPFNWMASLVAGLVLTDEAGRRHDPDAAVRWARRTIADLSEETIDPDVGIRLSALVLSAIGDAVGEARLTGDDAGVARWSTVADEFVELAERTAARPGRRPPEIGPEGV
ncbi:helix-turn-helix transcriptional regulator, partial [Streptomyces sp. SID3343]|nr:helix-turn-helix transcriptional regulator [Streptomyces sp. SID3343]